MSTAHLSDAQTAIPPYALEIAQDSEPWKCVGCPHAGNGRSHGNHHHEHQVPANVVPLPLLKRYTALAECPACRGVGPTNVKHRAGKGTHWMATFFFFTTGIFVFLPYAMDHFKNAEHVCMKCGRKLATQRFGGSTKAHLM
ncbi:litaf-like zinc finger domain-containing protein [Seiridium cupressi]|uniref:LITAF-like zinc ribbon domain-containing protein n=1 Tax=Seiridium unicorne TaxID=138068 RepID=A0ABR2VEY5_9PEZI